jgi:hypothetical protein
MRKTLLALLSTAALGAQAQTFDNVTFDCSGSLTSLVETPSGVRATGNVTLTVDLPNGTEWDSAGVIVIELPPQAAGRNVDGRALRRCRGRGQLDATVVDTVKGIEIYELNLVPNQVQLRIGNRRITDPTTVGFNTTAGGSPNV